MLVATRLECTRHVVACAVLLVSGLAGSAKAQSVGEFELKHAGTIFDAFSFDGDEVWTVEDGGRIRHRNGTTGAWTFQPTGTITKDLLYRVTFLNDSLTGWAVGQDSRYLWTQDGGTTWHQYQVGSDQLWDVDFINAFEGWLVAKHALYHTDNGSLSGPPPLGNNWTAPVFLYAADGHVMTPAELQAIDLISLDIIPGHALPGSIEFLGLLTAQPGLIFRTTDGINWQVVFDIRNLCNLGVLPSCMNGICTIPPPLVGFQPWDVEISRNPSSPIALVVGGLGNSCGLVLKSGDLGLTWSIEPHECTCGGSGCHSCTNDPLYNDTPGTQTDTWRYRAFNTLYSVSIFDEDNTAIAGGYGGQRVVRNAAAGVWEDRSQISNDIVHAVNAVTVPMYASAADGGNGQHGHGMLAGTGGYVMRTDTGGQSWSSDLPVHSASPYRIRDLCFINATTGWVVGQWFRIAKSTDGGVEWDALPNQVVPVPTIGGANYLSIAMNTDAQHGVAVGQSDHHSVAYPDRPKISFAVPGSSGQSWLEPVLVSDDASTGQGSQNKELREVVWAGGNSFWAAGQTGLIYYSNDYGQNWNQLIAPGYAGWPQMQRLEFQGLAFRDATTGIFVGSKNDIAFAYAYTGGANPTWTNIWPADPSVTVLSDVDIALGGNVAYAVGVKVVGGQEKGVVLASTFNGTSFGTFVLDPAVPLIDSCTVGDDLESVPVLNRVEITQGGDIWIGGECGRVWRFTPGAGSSAWYPFKSQTDAHIRGLSFPLAGNGFAAAFRASTSAYSVIGYH